MGNKYAEELQKEKDLLMRSNPFSRRTNNRRSFNDEYKTFHEPHYTQKKKDTNYFTLILSSDFEDLELFIRGLQQVREKGSDGKERIVYKRKKDHFLSESGSEDLLFELRGHLSSDIKLGIMTKEEFLLTQNIIAKNLISYIKNNMYNLGMDSEAKQRKASTMIIMVLNRIRSVYSRSIEGLENQRSHGDIKITGDLDMEREDRFRLDDMKN